MNHRELILSSRRRRKFHFLRLPEDLQDEIIDGLDRSKLTVETASDLIAERGDKLSHEAINGYYRAVRIERRLNEANLELARTIAEFAGKPTEEGLKGLLNLAIATATLGLADESIGVKNIDLARLLAVLPKMKDSEDAEGAEKQEDEKSKQLPPELLKKIREEIYGI